MDRRYERRHHRVGEKEATQEDKALVEFDLSKITLIVGIVCLIQGILIGLALRHK